MEMGQDEVAVMRIRARPGAYACGTETIEQILRAALNVLVEEGSQAFTLRRIAAECGMKVGNLSYYFPRKEDLVQELLEAVLLGYSDLAADMLGDTLNDPEQRLSQAIAFTLDDVRSKQTTNLFPELWALANHNEKVGQLVQEFYARSQRGLANLVKGVNASLSDDECRTVALFISATIEGTTIFAGHSKPWEPRMPQIKAMAIRSLIHLAKTLTIEDLRSRTGDAVDALRYADGHCQV
ncbi:TetR/AcrR family transcriptional regulator [Sphingomonas bacterium]|uniref:TetR/AcrR family transcriptional regulator n=1 Tax=Sphingomonas bacterium TaxID=1895847 RepID=UPI0020C6677F|nr:TetR/AcrR family transcriptional regulator [Sphingomonas bacterium]